MVGSALEWLAIQPNDRVLDLFCGPGHFSLPLARCAAAVAGREGVATPEANGQYNAHKNRLSHAGFLSYRLARVWMLDRFPHTGHLESMALLINGGAPEFAAK
jgi:23S rRNA (uracil1939-C5)-methyltransferase